MNHSLFQSVSTARCVDSARRPTLKIDHSGVQGQRAPGLYVNLSPSSQSEIELIYLAGDVGRDVPRTTDLGLGFASWLLCAFESFIHPGVGHAGSRQFVWWFRDASLPRLSSCPLEPLCGTVTHNN